jgi:FkbM family methyltransferase
MDRLYGRFVRPGELAFDIGAHVGDRIASFRRLGARVVALEPQPDCIHVLHAIYDSDREVKLIEAACGAREGMLTLHVNSANPTVSTASAAFVRAAAGAKGWEGQSWDREMAVRVTTLDILIAAHGTASFAKIDVEGLEHEVLMGVSTPLPALSFEFTTIQREVARRCLQRLATLGDYRFNISLGERHVLDFPDGLTAEEMDRHLAALPHEANSGDVYAVLTL